MQITLFGGPHDGRRITIDPAVAATGHFLVPDPPARPEYALPEPWEEYPTAITPQASHYRINTHAGLPRGPFPPDSIYVRWQYAGPA